MSALTALKVSLVLAPVVLFLLRRLHKLDTPCARSCHTTPTPRGGGVAPAIGAGAGLVTSEISGEPFLALLAAGALFGLIGLVEDLRGAPALPRLTAQLVVAVALLPWLLSDLGGPLVWRVLFGGGVVVWIASYVNAFNFMDGINGISVAQVVVAGLTWWAVAQWHGVEALATGALVLTMAALGFLPFNFPRARMFLGDVGSYFIGAWMAVLAVLGLRAGIAFEAVFAPLALYLADTGATLVRRARRRDTWYEPHRDHAYQRLHHQVGWSHTRTTAVIAVLMALASALGAVSLTSSMLTRVVADVALLGLIAGYLALPEIFAPVRHQVPIEERQRALAA